jgi:predicted transcriptional regulator
MTNETIKLELIEWLSRLENPQTIQYLKSVKDASVSKEDWWLSLSDNQIESIERGLRDIEEGHVVSHEDVKKRYGF